MKKIAINATILDEKPTGLGIYSFNIIKELSYLVKDKEIDLYVYTSNPNILKGLDVKIRKVNKFVRPKYGKIAGLLRFLWTQLIFPIRLKKEKIDLLYSTTHHGIFLTKVKQILTIHDLLPLKFPVQYKLQYYYFKIIIPFLLKNTYQLVTVSTNSKKDIQEYYHYKKRISIVYNSIDRKHFYPRINNKFIEKYGEYLLFVGASYPHKNLEKAIIAFLKSESSKNISMLITGGRKEYKTYIKEKFINEDEFHKRVFFLDYVTFEDLPILYSNAIALIYTSLYEGFGIPPLEAMACECPVIVSNTSSLPEVCGNAAIYIDPTNTTSIKEGINKVLLNENKKVILKKEGNKQNKKFSWRSSALSLLNLLEG